MQGLGLALNTQRFFFQPQHWKGKGISPTHLIDAQIEHHFHGLLWCPGCEKHKQSLQSLQLHTHTYNHTHRDWKLLERLPGIYIWKDFSIICTKPYIFLFSASAKNRVLVVCCELCSLHMQLRDDIDNLVRKNQQQQNENLAYFLTLKRRLVLHCSRTDVARTLLVHNHKYDTFLWPTCYHPNKVFFFIFAGKWKAHLRTASWCLCCHSGHSGHDEMGSFFDWSNLSSIFLIFVFLLFVLILSLRCGVWCVVCVCVYVCM